MDFLESLPGLGTVWHVVAAAAPQNRIRNRPESKREQLLRTFDAFRSQHLTAPRFFPYAIPLPHKGGGSRLSERHDLVHGATPCACNAAAYFTASMIFTYPVQRQMLLPNPSRISSSLGCGLRRKRPTDAMMNPGVQ